MSKETIRTLPMGTVFGDPLPGAPELARRGDTVTGVSTLELDQDKLNGFILAAYSGYAMPAGELSGALSAALAVMQGEPQDKDAVFLSRRHLMDHCGLGVQTPSGLYVLHCSQRGGVQLSTIGELRGQGYTGFSWWRRPNG